MFDPTLIRVEMARQNHTLESLSRATGLSVTGLHKVITGKSDPRTATIQKVADALNLKPAYFFASDFDNRQKRATP